MDEQKGSSLQPSTAINGLGIVKTDLELLRWRAEVLMDEMMLGGVDFAANGPTSVSNSSTGRAAWGRNDFSHEPQKNNVTNNAIETERIAQDGYQNGAYANSYPADVRKSVNTDIEQDEFRRNQSRSSSTKVTTTKNTTPSEFIASEAHAEGNQEPQPWVASAEDRYRQLVRPQPSATPKAAVLENDGAGTSSATQAIWQSGDNTHLSSANGHGDAHYETSLPTVTATANAVRRATPQFAGSMPIVSGSNRRSNLLPRLSTADVEVLQHEIFTLQNEIDHVLPVGHDSNKRVRHLLERAQAILQQDAMRSAEVEYYLQQVRTIFQRVQQTVDWSSIYRNRLFVYLIAWLLLSGIVLVACYLYQTLIEDFIIVLSGLTSNGLLLKHLLAAIATFFAGILGGALGSLANLQNHSRLPHGFIDRKFGLRGLILPPMGGIVGLLCYLPIGLLFSFFGLNPSQNILLSIFPVLLAFIYGVSQESIYGTRE